VDWFFISGGLTFPPTSVLVLVPGWCMLIADVALEVGCDWAMPA